MSVGKTENLGKAEAGHACSGALNEGDSQSAETRKKWDAPHFLGYNRLKDIGLQQRPPVPDGFGIWDTTQENGLLFSVADGIGHRLARRADLALFMRKSLFRDCNSPGHSPMSPLFRWSRNEGLQNEFDHLIAAAVNRFRR